MDQPLFQRPGVCIRHGCVRQVGGEHHVVRAERGAEQQRQRAVDRQTEARQVARVPVVQAVRAAASGDDVAAMVRTRRMCRRS